jgi:gamma-glutamylcyclotransferase (GGCT)/AIG2-like uncharacterized protein YtfP
MIFYFAYGSNMDEGQMRERCPGARLVSSATLNDYRLDFTIFSPKRKCGCADVVSAPGHKVYGLVYSISEEELVRLDGYENVPVAYKRNIAEVTLVTGKAQNAFIYEVVDKQPFMSPSKGYIGLLRNAAKKHAFPREYREMLGGVVAIDPKS